MTKENFYHKSYRIAAEKILPVPVPCGVQERAVELKTSEQLLLLVFSKHGVKIKME